MPRGERFNAVTHLVGAVLTLVGMAVLVAPPLASGGFKKALGFGIYGTSLFLAYLASTLYHSVRGEARAFYRRCDRVAIYLLIAGTYTPVAFLKLPPAWGWPLLIAVWLLATVGAAVELLLARRRRTLSVALYLFMGWMALVAVGPLLEALTVAGVAWMALGGVLFTLGAVTLRFKLIPRSHEVWHVLVLAGTACHFAVMLVYVR